MHSVLFKQLLYLKVILKTIWITIVSTNYVFNTNLITILSASHVLKTNLITIASTINIQFLDNMYLKDITLFRNITMAVTNQTTASTQPLASMPSLNGQAPEGAPSQCI